MLAAAAMLAAPAAAALELDPPAGWRTRTPVSAGALHELRDVLGHSVTLLAVPGGPAAYNRGAVGESLRRFARDAERAGGLEPGTPGRLKTAAFDNGAVADWLVSQAPGRVPLLLALVRFQENLFLLQVAAHDPEAVLRELLPTFRNAAAPRARAARAAEAEDRWLVYGWLGALAGLALGIIFFSFRLRRLNRRKRLRR